MRCVTAAFCGLMADAAASCGPSEAPGEEVSSAVPDTLHLVPTDTVGVELGDSSHVFGMVLAAEVDRLGRILALDPQLCRLSAYDAQGSYLGSAGGRGAGPGELQFPMDFAVLEDGGVAITDLQSGRLSFYDAGLAHTGSLEGFFPTPPMFLTGFLDSLFIAVDMTIDMEADPPSVVSRAGIWASDSAGPRTVLATLSRPASRMPSGDEPEERLAIAASDSHIFVGYVSVDRFLVEVYDADGALVNTIEKPWSRMDKTPEEMERGGMAISVTRSTDGESTTEARPTEDVVPWRNAIEQVGADGEGRLWVELGSRPFRPTFEVYDPRSGELLFAAVADSSLASGRISVSPGGFVHFDPDPEDYPRLVRLELRNQGSVRR